MAAPKGKKQSVTVMGITVHVDPNADVDPDYRMVAAAANGDIMALFRFQDSVLRDMLGDEYDRALDELQGEDDRLGMERVGEFFSELSDAVAALKN